jgi:RNA-splicing ligase RtcB
LLAPARGRRSSRKKPESMLQREGLVQGLRAMAAPLREIAESAPGVDKSVSDYLRLGILQQADHLENLT